MKNIYLVTSNRGKLKEWQAILPSSISLSTIHIDLPEIQSDNPEEVVIDKVKRAYDIAQKPVIVEDVGAGLESLQGLPGAFIKFFLKRLGSDVLYQLAGSSEGKAAVSCAAAYYDGTNLVTVCEYVHGKVVAPRGEQGFGFDATFIPNGQQQTYAEMDTATKNIYSHRRKAIDALIQKLQ